MPALRGVWQTVKSRTTCRGKAEKSSIPSSLSFSLPLPFQHKGVPYCHVPCYGALFGPQLFGHGSTVESHKSFGPPKDTPKRNEPKHYKTPQHEQLEQRLKNYNQFFNSKGTEIRSREVNGRLVLEGALRVYWGVQSVIHLKEDDDQRTVVTVRKRNSCRYSTSLEITDDLKEPLLLDPMATSIVSENGFDISASDSTTCESAWSEATSAGQVASNGKAGHSDEGESTSQEVSPVHGSATLPSKLDKKQLLNGADQWDELDDLLQVERKVEENEKLYQTLPTAISKSSSMDSSMTTTSTTNESAETTTSAAAPASNQQHEQLLNEEEDSSATLKPEDFDDFKRRMQREFLENANGLRSSNDGTLKAGLPIDPSRINDSLKLYGDQNMMSKSFSGAMGGPNKSYEIGEWQLAKVYLSN